MLDHPPATSTSGYTVGLTGGIGSGKSVVANHLKEKGVGIIDTDQIAHDLTKPAGQAIPILEARFGAGILDQDGALDRAKMRRLAFSMPQERQALEAILHPLIQQNAQKQAQQLADHHPYLVFVVPLLAEHPEWCQLVHRVVVVDCPEALQITRVQLRSGQTPEDIKKIMSAQTSRSNRLALADEIIANDRDYTHLIKQVDGLHHRLLALASARHPCTRFCDSGN